MKLLLLIFSLTILFSCSKNDDNDSTNSVEKLPPATQIGANTFGCLIDGKVFKRGYYPNATNCFYQIVDGEYYFALQANNNIGEDLIGIELGTNKKEIFENGVYDLLEYSAGNAAGGYLVNLSYNYTNNIYSGKMKITKLTNTIISGTFSFDVEDENGIVHEIREGRFDFEYTN